jgi:hypothetical protein
LPIKPDDVARVFDAACVQELATLARLPVGTDLTRFGESLRCAVQNAIACAAKPTPNALHREIAALHHAAEHHDSPALIRLIEQMTPSAWSLIQRRLGTLAGIAGSRPRRLAALSGALNWHIPDPAELRNPNMREAAADVLRALIITGLGGRSRSRPSGHPTLNAVPRLCGPGASRAEPRRRPERTLVMGLQLAVAETGAKVTRTARAAGAERKLGGFAQMVASVLVLSGLCGQAGAEGRAVRAVNDVHSARRDMLSLVPTLPRTCSQPGCRNKAVEAWDGQRVCELHAKALRDEIEARWARLLRWQAWWKASRPEAELSSPLPEDDPPELLPRDDGGAVPSAECRKLAREALISSARTAYSNVSWSGSSRCDSPFGKAGGASIAITRLDSSASELREAAVCTQDAKAARRTLAIALVLDGWSRDAAAEACTIDRQTLRDWVHRYNRSGLKGLADQPRRNGPRARLSDEQRAKVAWLPPACAARSALPVGVPVRRDLSGT